MTGRLPVVLPATARRLVTVLDGPCALVANRRGTVLHLYTWRLQRDAPTARGRLHRRFRPVCGQRGRGWTTSTAARGLLCGRCRGWLDRHPAVDRPERAATAEDLLVHLLAARTPAQLEACEWAVLHAGLAGRSVRDPGGRGRRQLSQIVADARSRVTGTAHDDRVHRRVWGAA